jgi:TPR repeat protein
MISTIPFFLFQISGSEISLAESILVISTLVLIVLGIVFGIPALMTWSSEKKKHRLKQRTLFQGSDWIKSTDLTYDSLDYTREMQDEQYPSSQRGITKRILEILNHRKEKETQNHILLVGPSLSGKSHITVSVLKTLADAYVLKPNETTFSDAAKEGFEFPALPQKAQYAIVLLDNFHEFFKGGASSPVALIHEAIENGFTIWANCISIEEYDRVNTILDFKNSGTFEEIKLDKKLDKDEELRIAVNLGVVKPLATSNGLIGEIIYKPTDIIQHYYDLKKESDTAPFDVLLLIKQAYLLGAFSIPYLMKIELLQKAYSKEYPTHSLPLRNALKKIEAKGFIKFRNDNSTISFDSVWLNEIVAPDLKPKEFFEFWKEIIPRTVIQYSHLIYSSIDYAEACRYYSEMLQDGIVPNVYTYTTLINLSPDYATAVEWFNKIERGKANVVTYSSLINLSPDYTTALEWLNRIEKGEANIITYNTLIKLSPNYNTAIEWFHKIEKGKANVVTYSSLINISPDYKTALEWFGKIEPGQASGYTYGSLINLSPDYETALEWFSKIEPGKANVVTYSLLINISPDYATALEWFNRIEPGEANVVTYSSLINLSPDYKTALEWFNKIEPGEANIFTYNTLIKLSPDYKTALEWFNKIEKGKADVFTFSSLINLSPDYKTALEWFNKIEPGKANVVTYNTLIKLSPDYNTVIEWYNKIEKGEANIFTYNTLISLSPDYTTALDWFNKIEPGKADVFTFNSLIKLSPEYFTALEWFNKMEPGKANVVTYSSLINFSPDYKTALEWFNKMEPGKANVVTYNTLIKLSPNYKSALEWFEKIDEGKASVVTYNTLIKLSPDYNTAIDWFNKIEPGKVNVVTYNTLISVSPEIDIGLVWLRRMETEGLKIDEYTYGALINLACRSRKIDKYQVAVSLHDEMLQKGIFSNVIIFTNLISLSPDFEQAFKLLEFMLTQKDKKGKWIVPNERTKKAMESKAFGKTVLLDKIEKWFQNNTLNFVS